MFIPIFGLTPEERRRESRRQDRFLGVILIWASTMLAAIFGAMFGYVPLAFMVGLMVFSGCVLLGLGFFWGIMLILGEG